MMFTFLFTEILAEFPGPLIDFELILEMFIVIYLCISNIKNDLLVMNYMVY